MTAGADAVGAEGEALHAERRGSGVSTTSTGVFGMSPSGKIISVGPSPLGLAAVAAVDGIDADERRTVTGVDAEEEAAEELVAAGGAALGDRPPTARGIVISSDARRSYPYESLGAGRSALHDQPRRQVEVEREEVALVRPVESAEQAP